MGSPAFAPSGLHRLTAGAPVAVALSGGVDSAAAAWLLKQAGFQVLGVHMILGTPGASADPAREAAHRLGIDFQVIDLASEFHRLVIAPFVQTYAAGRTPNPCAACNPAIKFGLLAQKAALLGADFLATGHYTALGPSGRLVRSPHNPKDQTYFLCRLSARELNRAVFPLAGWTKEDARRIARTVGLEPSAESQDVCFLSGGDYREFLQSRLPPRALAAGDFVDARGRVLGRHQGVIHYTVGQRRGLGLPGPEPYYVLAIDPDRRRVVLGIRKKTMAREIVADHVIWSGPAMDGEFDAWVQIRSRHRPAQARVQVTASDKVRVVFGEPQSSVAPGQAAAIYIDRELAGGGWIASAGNPESEAPECRPGACVGNWGKSV
jgi:tRNA-specific 2-thiouridylase